MKTESRKARAARHQRQAAYRETAKYKKWRRKYDRDRYAAGLVKSGCWSKTHPIRAKRYQRDWALKKRYGISLLDFESLLTKQRKRCAVCRVKHTRRRPLHVDHCHKTSRVRGLLCFVCNTALGKLGDSIKLVRKLVSYLEAPCA